VNLAIEYLIRGDKIKSFLKTPCSLMLTSIRDANHLVLVIKDDSVRHYRVNETPKNGLPPFSEYKITKENIFTSDKVILPGYMPIPFTEDPFKTGAKQRNDANGVFQEIEYTSCLATFYNPPCHINKRINWIWNFFQFYYMPLDYRFTDNKHFEQQRLFARYAMMDDDGIWDIWCKWREEMVDYYSFVAPELIFSSCFTKPLLRFKNIMHK
jgi:hypothetical protein